jgi:hypothetical protein
MDRAQRVMAEKPESENPLPSIPSPAALLYETPSEGCIPLVVATGRPAQRGDEEEQER